jgi:hypothetical protein
MFWRAAGHAAPGPPPPRGGGGGGGRGGELWRAGCAAVVQPTRGAAPRGRDAPAQPHEQWLSRSLPPVTQSQPSTGLLVAAETVGDFPTLS